MAVRYDVARGPSGGPQPGTVALRNHWLRVTGLGDLGIYNPRRVRGGQAWSIHAEGRAFDGKANAHKLGEREKAERYVRFLIEYSALLHVQQIIWNRRIWRSGRGWRDYTGTSPHTDHVHVEQNRTGARVVTNRLLDTCWAEFTAPDISPQEDDDMASFALARIEYLYRSAGRDPHKDPKGLLYWSEQLKTRDADVVERECGALLYADATR